MMRAQGLSRPVWIGGCTVLMYAVLVVVSASCGIAHAQQGGDSHYHQERGASAQGAVCAWQLTSQSAVAVEPPDAAIGFVAEVVLPTTDSLVAPFKCLVFPSQVSSSNTAQSHHQHVRHCGGIDTISDSLRCAPSAVGFVGALWSTWLKCSAGYGGICRDGPTGTTCRSVFIMDSG